MPQRLRMTGLGMFRTTTSSAAMRCSSVKGTACWPEVVDRERWLSRNATVLCNTSSLAVAMNLRRKNASVDALVRRQGRIFDLHRPHVRVAAGKGKQMLAVLQVQSIWWRPEAECGLATRRDQVIVQVLQPVMITCFWHRYRSATHAADTAHAMPIRGCCLTNTCNFQAPVPLILAAPVAAHEEAVVGVRVQVDVQAVRRRPGGKLHQQPPGLIRHVHVVVRALSEHRHGQTELRHC